MEVGRIARPTCCSTDAAQMLMGTLVSAPHMPLRNAPAANTPTLPVAVPSATRPNPTTFADVATTSVVRLPKRATTAPVTTTAVRVPTPPTTSSAPSWPELSPSASRTDGRRLIQDVPMTPNSANCTMSAHRARETTARSVRARAVPETGGFVATCPSLRSRRAPRPPFSAAATTRQRRTVPATHVTLDPPTQTVPVPSRSTCTRPARPSAAPWAAT